MAYDDEFPAPAALLGYLLKHAQARMADLGDAALEPVGVTSRELGVLLTVAEGEPPSQQQAALRLGVDRTTMVAILDALEGKGLVARRPHAQDRRRNVVTLTEAGVRAVREAVRANEAAEAELLAALDADTARSLREALRLIVQAPPH
ncbi:MarR family transcriptional regulator [Actinacidiphila sp. DG2A-62]|jgi:DNA-binding MarR family transcriptional regulator|uniref:MarR family winged helix-turn-helix transcriptional regulator n=1 Tax=Actinacidiphila sp. DG2A-62 TaxID=3108821 RepID=UPI002DBD6D97|nr:MarR family transcriptional regulator [Actinacidiphila sp. DG2A-62]MEC3992465.1 MarR family transcriptional regulator [Actinacidiphila sp. DG2A-62]